MNTLLVVNGESDWGAYFPELEVQQRRLQTSKWLLRDGELWVFDASGALRVEAVLWRLGAVKPQPQHRTVLELIRLAGIPCVNPAQTLLRGYERLAMLAELRELKIPLVPFSVALGEGLLERLAPQLPAVLKVGNYHGGWGKARAATPAQWDDLCDVAFVSDDYVTVEPFVDYVRDIRCLAIGDQLWAMERRGAGWKVNRQTLGYDLIEAPPQLVQWTKRAMQHFGADILGLDFLETRDGEFLCLESNDIPGLSGFPEATRLALAARMRKQMEVMV